MNDIPTGHKARVRILVEKRIRDYDNLRLAGSYINVYYGRNGGKKLNDSEKSSSSFNSIAISTKLKGKDDIISFAIVHESPKVVETDCYVNVFCEFNFSLYDIDDPEREFQMGSTVGAVLDNFSYCYFKKRCTSKILNLFFKKKPITLKNCYLYSRKYNTFIS